ncbi:bifunctional DNA primase/helicase [Bacteroides heparinolyticus]|uniref:bifunctional DNA primase/helicase n=1 Tax=Prevotella heparinolytica TaxID=28113 RepID=UPI00359F9CA7
MKAFYFLEDFPERKSAGKNFTAKCPQCGKKHLSISKATGLMHCFYAGCGFSGKLRDFWENRPYVEASAERVYMPLKQGKRSGGGDAGKVGGGSGWSAGVPMIPEDYRQLSQEVLERIKPITDDPDTTDADQLAARRYLAAQGISTATAMKARLGCLTHRCFGKEDDEKRGAGSMYHCIAYVNYVNGRPVNVKYRSCDPSKVSGFTKCWSQDSPTTPCAPYNIDCINPLLVAEEHIPKLIITEGGKDALTLSEAGYPFVISVPNGAASDLYKSFEAFDSWLDYAQSIVICGDTDLPGRTLTKHLSDYFGNRCLLTTLPHDCKDISDVLVKYGIDVVREIIDTAKPQHTADIITVGERKEEVLSVLRGEYDHGYDVGYGPLTNRIFRPTDQGGLMIVTGKPNCGKTDFLNDLTCRIMAKTGRNVCYLSFEVPDKNKHIARLVKLMLGKANTTGYTGEQLQPIIDFLNAHMVHLDLHELSPTPEHILNRADMVRRSLPMHYLVIDPYLFMEVETGKNATETQSIKSMLTQLQSWGRMHKIWVVIVAHPRKLQKLSGRNELEDIDMYTIAGSANWANLADFIFSLTRVEKPDRAYTRLDMLKVRDQELCRTGNVLFVRQPCGRYDERETEEQVIEEAQGKILIKDEEPWVERMTH